MPPYKCPHPKTNCGPLPKFGAQKNQFLTTFFATSALDTAYLRNETSHRQTKMLVLIYNVSPKSVLISRDLWPSNGWNPFRHFDPPYRRPLRCNHHSCDMSSWYFSLRETYSTNPQCFLRPHSPHNWPYPYGISTPNLIHSWFHGPPTSTPNGISIGLRL